MSIVMRKFKLTMGDDIRTFESESPSDVLESCCVIN